MNMSKNNKKYGTGPISYKIQEILSLECFKEEKIRYFHDLSEREKEVLLMVAQGMKNSEIATKLRISPVTVQNHRANVRQKLSLNNESDYFKYAFAFDLIPF